MMFCRRGVVVAWDDDNMTGIGNDCKFPKQLFPPRNG